MQLRKQTNQYFLTAALMLLPSAVFATDIGINGICVTGQGLGGDCTVSNLLLTGSTDSVGISPAPSSTSNSGSSNILVGLDSDPFTVSWSYSASYSPINGSTLIFDPTVVYTGTSATTTNDTITVDLFQAYYDTAPGSWSGTYGETVNMGLSAGVGASSYVQGQACFTAGVDAFPCLSLETLNGPGPASVADPNTSPLTLGSGNNLLTEYEYTYYFAAGTTNGATVTSPSPVPEPAQALPLGLVLLGLVWYSTARRRRTSFNS
jgi:hypothetical protein